jgi:DeoD family purine-nucleoside phosphorylase
MASQGAEAPEASSGDVLEEDALDGILRAEFENLDELRGDCPLGHAADTLGLTAVPIHVRAEPGDYAETCLLPGDPLRAKYIAETFLDDAVQRNAERAMLGYTGTFRGKPVSVQSTGMGCPSAAIVIEELAQLGVKRMVRVGTCGGLQPDMKLGDLIVAVSAVPADATARHLVGEPDCPTANWELVHAAVHAAKELGEPVRVGAVVSSDLFYNPDEGQYARWSARGVLAVEMEAAILFTLGALRGVQAGCLLTVSDVVVEGEFVRISDEEMRRAVDQMTELALASVTAEHH